MRTDELCIAVDYGGTKLKIGLVKRNGEVVLSRCYPTGFRSHAKAATCLIESIDLFIKENCSSLEGICGIGIGLVGTNDYKNGVWEMMYGEAEDTPVKVAELLTEKYSIPCFLDNDVKAALSAELEFGIGRKSDNFAFVNVGTGIAAGIVCDGHILRGINNNAGEICGYPVRNGSLSAGGKSKTVEQYASGGGIKESFLEELENSSYSLETDTETLNACKIFDLAESGNEIAKLTMRNAVVALADLIENVVWTCSSEYIVFGGGVMHDDRFYAQLTEEFQRRDLINTEICRTVLSPKEIGLLGAAVLCFRNIESMGKKKGYEI